MPRTARQYHLRSPVPHSCPSLPLKVTARWSGSLRGRGFVLRWVKVSSQSPSIDQPPPNHRPSVTVPTQSPPHTSAVIVPSQPRLVPAGVRVPSPSRPLGRRPLVRSYRSVTVPPLSLPWVTVPRCPRRAPPSLSLTQSSSPSRGRPTGSSRSRSEAHPAGPHLQPTSPRPRPGRCLPGAASRTREVEEVVGRRPGKAADGTAGRKSRLLPAPLSIRRDFSVKTPTPDTAVPPPPRTGGGAGRKPTDGDSAEGQPRGAGVGGGLPVTRCTCGRPRALPAVRQGAAPPRSAVLPGGPVGVSPRDPRAPLCAGLWCQGVHSAGRRDTFRQAPRGPPLLHHSTHFPLPGT